MKPSEKPRLRLEGVRDRAAVGIRALFRHRPRVPPPGLPPLPSVNLFGAGSGGHHMQSGARAASRAACESASRALKHAPNCCHGNAWGQFPKNSPVQRLWLPLGLGPLPIKKHGSHEHLDSHSAVRKDDVELITRANSGSIAATHSSKLEVAGVDACMHRPTLRRAIKLQRDLGWLPFATQAPLLASCSPFFLAFCRLWPVKGNGS